MRRSLPHSPGLCILKRKLHFPSSNSAVGNLVEALPDGVRERERDNLSNVRRKSEMKLLSLLFYGLCYRSVRGEEGNTLQI